MNVVLVTVDSLRADRVTDRVMPAARSFADGAIEFTDCVANGPSTPASFPSIHASRHFASIEGLGIPEAGSDDGIRTLAEQLQGTDYATAGYTDNHFASGSYHYDRGFEEMYDASGTAEAGRLKQFVQSNLDKDGPLFRTIETVYNRADALFASATGQESEYERAASLNERALDWIDDQSGEWFTWLHYMDVHHPYEAPEEYQRQFLDEPLSLARCRGLARKGTHHPEELSDREWELIRGLYDAECAYADDQFDALLGALRERNLFDETIVLFTADHGELIGEHGHAGHPPEFWEGVVHVPFALHVPGRDADTVDRQIRLLDVAPTIADAAGVEPFADWTGESALELVDGDVDAREYAFGDVGRQVDYGRCYARRSDGWKLLRHAEDGEFCFDISETPEERAEDDRSADQPPEYDELSSALDDHQERMQRLREGGLAGIEEDAEIVEEHLKDLGYME
ncbi:Arylsulfatase A [Natronoarchaeum philippinense]|uniref:Arylsulfatase A n=1 Tax=Natronoarchaeum philippinense TaxID=558529 RepID=A0A285NBI1_NATPI|nr:sulfatase-like hydrolase/transferase [Natronoarchaeum philippinense]SNZ06780.1 Arylsulfatase A [Natronoarchaeum philippinense]